MTKKKMPIDALIRWAYTVELPKAQARGRTFLRPEGWAMPWGAVTKTGMLGAEIDEPDIRNRYGLAPDVTAHSDPHPDAVRLYNEVRGLDELSFDVPEDWYPLADICPEDGPLAPWARGAVIRGLDEMLIAGPSTTEAAVSRGARSAEVVATRAPRRTLRRPVSDLIRRIAVLGPPDTAADTPSLEVVRATNGRPRYFIRETIVTATGPVEVEVDGYDRKRRLPKPGAYTKSYLDPDPADVVLRRAEHQVWHAACGILVTLLHGRLEAHAAEPADFPPWPWETGQRPAPRVLLDLRPPQPSIVRPPRPLAGPPPKRGITRHKERAQQARSVGSRISS